MRCISKIYDPQKYLLVVVFILMVEVVVVFVVLVVVFTNLPPEHGFIEIDMKDEDGRGNLSSS